MGNVDSSWSLGVVLIYRFSFRKILTSPLQFLFFACLYLLWVRRRPQYCQEELQRQRKWHLLPAHPPSPSNLLHHLQSPKHMEVRRGLQSQGLMKMRVLQRKTHREGSKIVRQSQHEHNGSGMESNE